jgi:hypothetical protein
MTGHGTATPGPPAGPDGGRAMRATTTGEKLIVVAGSYRRLHKGVQKQAPAHNLSRTSFISHPCHASKHDVMGADGTAAVPASS